MLISFVRTAILYLLVIIVMRIMGKRQIGELQPFELVIAIMISDLASVAMQNTGVPLVNGIIPILTLLVAQLLFSYIGLKSAKTRAIISGRPTVLIENGKLKEQALKKEMFTINELLEQLRIKNISNISDVEFAILETNGQLSVIPKSQKRPLNPEDLNIQTEYEGLPLDLIVDGNVNTANLKTANLDEKWLSDELKKFGVENIKDVLFASLDSSGNLYFQVKEKKGEDN
ncbi:MAG TPA: DUF421 domain-containing protein [Ruminiclostridium sp.]|uniref:YetF C-terminal domain-containing protein n=1 Tax=Acetivibrio saccincola TaxID=1677857 RepID=A0A2K9ECU5_9FIRM|nr:DUF421 domain-containing protein [Acetivibrio saccincola]HAA43631.1 DUF421 domain-containing protein [Ruminiclostridium sp.]AUG57035.1 hypothetical protein HVS_05525 [Acetivibrio saccincola]NLW25923.1 DUF421 domain-containing protein [Acetivibrio saccincola]PQQ67050.1 hypothetical protein B9R14_10075 [Acetivibrio saccincola]HOA98104.1 DUF421 domain-containing protein [Acetivibrio saccincola]